MPQKPLQGFDVASFWEDSDYARKEYVDDPLTPEKVTAVQKALKYRLPAAYVALCRMQNGGLPRRTCHRTSEPTSWAKDHVALSGIYSIGDAKPNSLCGSFGSQFWIDIWGYPPIGVYFADCPSAGHDMFCLDYRQCGPQGEPAVVHLDQECDYKITFVAQNFEAFIRGLQDEDAYVGDA
jgi:hypothetical protein